MPTLILQPREFLRKEPFSPNLFHTDKAVTLEHIWTVFGERLLSFPPDDVELLRKEVGRLKKEATSWGHTKVERRIVDHLGILGYPELSQWRNVKENWKNDELGEFPPIYWKAFYGMFDTMSGWETELEREYLRDVLEMSYTASDDRTKVSIRVILFVVTCHHLLTNSFSVFYNTKGCFAKLFTRSKVRCIKQVNSLRKDMQIRKNRMKEELTEDNRKKRRKKGTALGAYAVVKGTKMFAPDIDMGVLEASDERKQINLSSKKSSKKPKKKVVQDDETTLTSISAVSATVLDCDSDSDDAEVETSNLPDFPDFLELEEDEEKRKLKVRYRNVCIQTYFLFTNLRPVSFSCKGGAKTTT